MHAFRTDKEATEIKIPSDNIDLSNTLTTADNTTTLEGITESSRAMFKELSPYAEIKTNRLHIAISAALLGKKTILHKIVTLKTLQYTVFIKATLSKRRITRQIS